MSAHSQLKQTGCPSLQRVDPGLCSMLGFRGVLTSLLGKLFAFVLCTACVRRVGRIADQTVRTADQTVFQLMQRGIAATKCRIA